MTETLGYDCRGEALRAGDRVKVVHVKNVPGLRGAEATVLGVDDIKTHLLLISIPHPAPVFDWYGAPPTSLLRINSGRDVFSQACSRALAESRPGAQHEWAEPER